MRRAGSQSTLRNMEKIRKDNCSLSSFDLTFPVLPYLVIVRGYVFQSLFPPSKAAIDSGRSAKTQGPMSLGIGASVQKGRGCGKKTLVIHLQHANTEVENEKVVDKSDDTRQLRMMVVMMNTVVHDRSGSAPT